MARIRSLKPEFWDDRKLARSCSRDARMLYMGLWNQADEHARLNGDGAWIKGRVFPFDDDIGIDQILVLLKELESAGRIVQYELGGDPYVFLPHLGKHQRLESKVESRLPPPPPQDHADKSASHADSSASRAEKFAYPQEPVRIDPIPPYADKSASHADSSALLYVAGSREQVAGSRVDARARATPDDPPSEPPDEPSTGIAVTAEPRNTAQTILAEWIDRVPKRPPSKVIGQTSTLIGGMLAEGIDPDDIRRGMAAWITKGLHPSTLPSVVNEVMNTKPAAGRATAKAAGWLTVGTEGNPP